MTMTEGDEGLSREIGKWDLIALLINVTVGAGIFRLPADVQKIAGSYSLVAFVLCAAVIGLIALCFAEVGSRFSGTGGPYLYAKETFGPATGFTVGWLMYLTRLAGIATLTQVFVAYLGYFWPRAESGLPRVAIITTLIFGLTVINVIGTRESARVSNIFTASKLIPLFVFVAVGLLFISRERFTFGPYPGAGPLSSAVFVLVFAFSGFEAVLINSGEIRQPQRVIPISLFLALGAAVILFVMIQTVCIGTLPQLAASQRPLADASQNFLGAAGPTIISAGALISIFGTLNAVMLALTRLPFALAVQNQLPWMLTRVHQRYRTPHLSILVSATAALVLALTGTFIYAVRITVITRVIVYASTCLALPVLRRRARLSVPAQQREGPTPFELPWGGLIAIVSVILCLWLLAQSGWSEVRDVAIAVSVGLVIYAITRVGLRRSRQV